MSKTVVADSHTSMLSAKPDNVKSPMHNNTTTCEGCPRPKSLRPAAPAAPPPWRGPDAWKPRAHAAAPPLPRRRRRGPAAAPTAPAWPAWANARACKVGRDHASARMMQDGSPGDWRLERCRVASMYQRFTAVELHVCRSWLLAAAQPRVLCLQRRCAYLRSCAALQKAICAPQLQHRAGASLQDFVAYGLNVIHLPLTGVVMHEGRNSLVHDRFDPDDL
jgi:hypothetical protein